MKREIYTNRARILKLAVFDSYFFFGSNGVVRNLNLNKIGERN